MLRCQFLEQPGRRKIHGIAPVFTSAVVSITPHFNTGDFHLTMDLNDPKCIPGFLLAIDYNVRRIAIFTDGESFTPIDLTLLPTHLSSTVQVFRRLEQKPLASLRILGIYLTKLDQKIINHYCTNMVSSKIKWMDENDIKNFLATCSLQATQ